MNQSNPATMVGVTSVSRTATMLGRAAGLAVLGWLVLAAVPTIVRGAEPSLDQLMNRSRRWGRSASERVASWQG